MAAFIALILIGYDFGGIDHAVHIPFLKAWADPTLYPNDPFIELRKNQYSFFWFFFLPLLKNGWLAAGMFLVHFFSTVFFFKVVWDLSITLFSEPLAALFAVLSFIMPHTGFVGFPVIEFSLQSRTFVLPFLLLAINLFLNKRYYVAFLVLGLMFNLNLLMSNFVLAALVFCFIIDLPQKNFATVFKSIGFFMMGALPVFFWKLTRGPALDFSIHPEWFSVMTRGVLFQVFYLVSDKPFMVLTLSGICGIALFSQARKNQQTSMHDRQIVLILSALIGITVLQEAVSHWVPITAIVQMQISRAAVFILIIAHIYFSSYLAKTYSSQEIRGGNFVLLAGSFFFSIFSFLPLMFWLAIRKYPLFFLNRRFLSGVIVVIMVGVYIFFAFQLEFWHPGIRINAKSSAWVEAQNWARNNTAKDALFITPPQEVGLFQPDWRVFSERGTVASLYDLFEISLIPEYYSVWKPRFESLAPGAIEQFDGIYFKNQDITRLAYNNLEKEDFQKIACRYKAAYLVREKDIKFPDLEVVHENECYFIYTIGKVMICD